MFATMLWRLYSDMREEELPGIEPVSCRSTTKLRKKRFWSKNIKDFLVSESSLEVLVAIMTIQF